MAFCSECGKSNVDQAVVCDGCGKPLRGAAKGAAPVRFKGTMIMGATVPKPVATPTPTPAATQVPTPAPTPAVTPAQQPNLAFQATMMGPMTAPGGSVPPAAAATVPAAAASPAAAPVSPKGTMIGGMGGLPGALQIPGPSSPTAGSAPTPAIVPPAAVAGEAASPAVPGVMNSPSQRPGAAAVEVNYSKQGDYGAYGAAPGKNNKTWLWVALGVVGALGFACVGTGLALYFGAVSFGDKVGGAMTDFAKRAQVTVTLSSIHTACAAGDCSQASPLFHPRVRDRLLPQATTVTPAALAVFGDIQKSEAVNLAGSGDESVAKDLDIDPKSCVRLSVGASKVIGCSVAEGVAQIVAMENLGAIN